MSEVPPPADRERPQTSVDWMAVANGALVALALLATASIVVAILDDRRDDFDGSPLQRMMLIAIFVAYAVAGAVAARAAGRAPLTNGALAATGGLVAWLPLRALIWVLHDSDRGLVSGNDPIFTVGALFGHLVIASAFGMLGAFAYVRWARRRATSRPGQLPPDDRAAA